MSVVPRLSHGILSLTIKTKEELYQAYLPFISNGGLFIPTLRSYHLGEEVFMLLDLMDEADKVPVTGKVVWLTPKGAQGGRTPGIGIQLTPDDSSLVNKIETYLAGTLNSDRKTNAL
ncbi:PilZ domain-containing protein [Neptuniibacter sp. CAU 1671]|uniref:PilZ domain-containing protein n=1 Tax=Neptuniibacter sp. CAU 1671 TaxID=3032593 RepID=UPI0023DC6488|nr:PilZ domain-containing protein [Neptuniibacter sp. CAU 1671]MDF2180498.1 PilZ domain-containing protein [Neptuniibacter sp. CAU 1671]